MTRYRKPTEERPARLEPLAKLPIFLALEGKRAVVAGGGEASVWKVELLAATGALVEVFAADPCEELIKLIATYEETVVRLWRRTWAAADLEHAAVAVGNFADDVEADAFAQAARELHVPVNVIDRPAYCDFQFGAIVNRSPVVVAISTNGAAPVLSQAIRRRIEASLPVAMGAWASAALSFRARLANIIPAKTNRRRFWEAFVDCVFSSDQQDPQQELESLADEYAKRAPSKKGEVVLVGAGPGDPELLTLKAVRALQSADVIIHDRLVTPAVLELARREARRIEVGKRGHGAACRQDEINDLVIGLAREGKRVVRLKGGDPSIFGRAGEEIAACKEAGIAVHIVPGVTTALAAAAALNISLTHRDHAQRVQFVTGHDRDGQLPPELDLDALSDPNATTCVYMAGCTIVDLARRLIARGLARETSVALVANVSRPNERVERSTLGALAGGEIELTKFGPVIALIGNSIGAADEKRIAVAVSRTPIAA